MTIGNISDNLLTNDSLIGQYRKDFQNQVILEVEFSNSYTGDIIPDSLKVRNVDRNQTYTITSTPEAHNFGDVITGRFNSLYKTENNKLQVIGDVSTDNTHAVVQIFKLQLLELQVGDKIYTDFVLKV